MMDAKKIYEPTAALFHMVVTVTLASAMQITLNGSNQFIGKLSKKQKKTIRDASTSSENISMATPG